jgi:hypothetical protein
LTDWAFHCTHTKTIEQNLPFLAEGSEHLVYFDGVNGDVLKITRVGLFGAHYELIKGRIHEFKCTPRPFRPGGRSISR